MSTAEVAEQDRLIEQLRQSRFLTHRYCCRSQCEQSLVRRFLGGARLDCQLNEHLRHVECRERAACQPLMNTSLYRDWSGRSEPKHQKLAVIGSMGCGKSTNMSIIIQSLVQPPDLPADERTHVDYYYHLDENATPFHIIASLTDGLVTNSVSLQNSLYDWYMRARARFEHTDEFAKCWYCGCRLRFTSEG